ncbi:MAG: protein kinase [Myxococcales bacterium]|nr:protein kinase [Myxococcales bacterium]
MRPGALASTFDPSTAESTGTPARQDLVDTGEGPGPAAEEAGVPAQVGRFRVLRRVGEGGMGVVHAAYDGQLDRVVALKLLHGARHGAEFVGRFIREAQALAQLAHPNVVAIHEVGASEGRVFLTMEFVRGRTLREGFAGLPPRDRQAAVLDWMLQAGRGLAAVHRAGLVHRDIKPDNVMVGDDGRVRVMDFGLVRVAAGPEGVGLDAPGPALAPELTRVGAVLGTPAYMAPEQHRGELADPRSDVFGFCATLYEGLHGAPPFAGATYTALRAAALHGDMRAPAGSHVPAWLRAVVQRGLEFDPAARWQTMDDLLAALAADPLAARRRRLRGAALGLLLVALAILATLAVLGAQRSQAAAQTEALAAEHLAGVLARPPEEAEAAFTAFVTDRAHHGTRALVRAWHDRGDRRSAARDDAGALAAYGHAYAEAREPEDARAALRGIAGVHLESWNTRALGRAARALGDPADDADLRAFLVTAALRRRDLAGALRLISDAQAPPALGEFTPVLAALSRGRALPAVGDEAVILPPGGDAAVAVFTAGHREVTLLDAALRPLRHWRPDAALFMTPGAPWVMARRGEVVSVHDLRAPEHPLLGFHAQHDAQARRALDLDGDGQDELVFRFALPERGFRVLDLADGSIRVAHPASERAGSDLESVVAADLDGDGAQEVVAAFGPHRAYDLRVFRADEEGRLTLVARHPLGRFAALALIRRPDGELVVAAAKDGTGPNLDVFPEPPHLGAPPGVYLFGWTGDALVERAFMPHPDRRVGGYGYTLAAADLDGDGRDELTLPFVGGTTIHTLVARQAPDGSLSALVLGDTLVLDAGQLDDDPSRELLVADSETLQVIALGVGDAPSPVLAEPTSTPTPPPPLGDEVLRARWSRADELAAIGVPGAGAALLRDAAEFVDDPDAQRRLRDHASALFAAAGDLPAALALSVAGLTAPELAAGAFARRVTTLSALGRHAEAADAARALVEVGGPEARLGEDALARLGPLLDPALTVTLGFDGPLAPVWRIERPAALRRLPGGDALRVESTGALRRLASLPVVWDGGPLHLEVELDARHIEYDTSLGVGLFDADGALLLGVSVGGGGHRTRAQRHHKFSCTPIGHRHERSITARSVDTADVASRAVLRLTYFPDRGVVECTAENEELRGRHEFAVGARPAPGPLDLAIGSFVHPDGSPHLVAADLRRISLRGARLDPRPATTAEDLAALALVDGEPLAAKAALARAEASSLRGALIDLLARDDLREPTAGEEVLAALPDDDLLHLLRVRPGLLWGAQAALGDRFLPLLARAWTTLARHHADDPSVHLPLLRQLAGIAALSPATPAERAALGELRHARGMLLVELDEPLSARRDLEAALTELAGADDLRTRVHLALARLLAEADPGRARAHVDAALASAPAPEVIHDQLRRDPRLSALSGPDGDSAPGGPASGR